MGVWGHYILAKRMKGGTHSSPSAALSFSDSKQGTFTAGLPEFFSRQARIRSYDLPAISLFLFVFIFIYIPFSDLDNLTHYVA